MCGWQDNSFGKTNNLNQMEINCMSSIDTHNIQRSSLTKVICSQVQGYQLETKTNWKSQKLVRIFIDNKKNQHAHHDKHEVKDLQ